jgi:hypothetical protein
MLRGLAEAPMRFNFPSFTSSAIRPVATGAAVAALLCVYGFEVTRSSRDLSAVWDEPTHILAGFRYWQAGDYGVNPEHPPLAKLVATLPLNFLNLKSPGPVFDDSKPIVVISGRQFIYGNHADAILLRARLADAVIGLILMLLLLEAGYRMFGVGVGLIAALLAAFEPNLLAHSTVVGTDLAFACFNFAAVFAFWRLAERPSLLRLAGCGVMAGLALASKHSALLLLPTLAVLAGLEIAWRVKGEKMQMPAKPRALRRETMSWSARLLAIYGLALVVLWGFYAFRYQARPDGAALWMTLPKYAALLKEPIARTLITTAARLKVLPESYLFGLIDVMIVTAGPRLSFVFGHLYPHAVWYYFPVAFAIKSTLGFISLLLVAVLLMQDWAGELYRKAAYLLIPPMLFMGTALFAGTNMGIRHVLPIYPFFILAAAAGALALARRYRAGAFVVAALMIFHIVSSSRTVPDYLAYSNELFGGTAATYRVLSDSNVDWGQGLREAGDYLARRHITECWLAYFGTADPAYYHLPCKALPDPYLRWWHDPIPVPPETYRGTVLISATEMAAPYWGSQALNPYIHFLHMKPLANIGGSILVYEGDIDLRRASAAGHMYRAWDLINGQQQEAAIQEALKAENMVPQHPGPPFIVGYILSKAQRTEAARVQFEESLKLAEAANPQYQSIWIMANKAQLAILP